MVTSSDTPEDESESGEDVYSRGQCETVWFSRYVSCNDLCELVHGLALLRTGSALGDKTHDRSLQVLHLYHCFFRFETGA